MRFVLSIECDNAAFGDDYRGDRSQQRNEEVARILAGLAARMENTAGVGKDWPLFDVNGNLVGYAEYKA